MTNNDFIRAPRGQVTIFVEEGGVRTLAFKAPNLVVDNGRKLLSRRLAGVSYQEITQIRLGRQGHVTGDVTTPKTPSVGQTSLNDPDPLSKTQLVESPIFVFALPEVSARFVFVLEKEEGNGSGVETFTEAGLFTADNQMFAVENFPALVKNADRRFIFEWVIYF